MASPNILISGSGIAGSALSFWLLRAYPEAKITIVERDPALRLTGASVDIRSSAVDIIKWMGVEQEIRNEATKEEGGQFVDANNKVKATIRASGRSDIQTFTSEFEIFRGALAKIFVDKIIDRVTTIFDETVASYEERDDKVFVTFTKSKEVKAYDLLVAADGFGSKIRGMMFGVESQEHLFDEGVHVAYFSIKRDLLDGDRMARWYNAPGGRCILLRPDPHPDGRTRAHFMNVTTSGDVETKAMLNKALRGGNESYKKLMEEMFHDAGWKAPEVLQGMRESDDFYCSLFGQVRAPALHAGRVVLLGDAGYATPGLGTSLAIMGGYVLAGELLRHPGDAPAAARAYGDLMLPFVKGSQGGEKAMQYLNPQTAWGIAARNAVVGFLTWLRVDRLLIHGAAALGLKEKMLSMPDYSWPVQ